ncbi:hypothetical protein [Streptomyces sp. NPDC059166]|uniref:hypothetical protein n=1 Tax=Streptomyces sp. NPDC059166 TaxID=3346752 RepID=UPI0036B3E491
MDWGWLLGIGVLKPFHVADQLGLPLREHSERLRESLLALGHVRDDEGFRVPLGLIRLALHRGDADLNTLTGDDVEEMRHAIRHCERIPGLLQVVGADHCPTLKLAWATNAFRTGLALFHTGITDRPPLREETTPPPRLCSKPRIDAVFERFLVERALVLRPESMSSTRAGCAASACGWTPSARTSTASTSWTAPTWSRSWSRSTGCARSSIPTSRSAGPTGPASSRPSPCSSAMPPSPNGTTSRPAL